jgi:hypothetical protein
MSNGWSLILSCEILGVVMNIMKMMMIYFVYAWNTKECFSKENVQDIMVFFFDFFFPFQVRVVKSYLM